MSTLDSGSFASALLRGVKLEAVFKKYNHPRSLPDALEGLIPGHTCLITFENNHVERLFIVFAATFLHSGDCQAKIKLIAGGEKDAYDPRKCK